MRTAEVTTTITRTELGGIWYMWVRLEGRPSVSIGRADEGLSRELLIERANSRQTKEKQRASALQKE